MSVKFMARAAAATCVLAAALTAGGVASAQSYYNSNSSYGSQDNTSNYSSSSDRYKHSRHHKSRYHHARYDVGRDQGRYENSRYQGEGMSGREGMNGMEEGQRPGMERANYTPPAFQVPLERVHDARNALKGATVRDEDGNSVGSVRDIVASPDGGAEAIRINVGGMWGMNGKTVVVDARDFRYEGDRHELTADLSKGQIESLPGVKQ